MQQKSFKSLARFLLNHRIHRESFPDASRQRRLCSERRGGAMVCEIIVIGHDERAATTITKPTTFKLTVHGSHSLSTSMLGVRDRITNDIFQKDFEDTTSLFVDETRDTLDTATTSKTTNGGLCNTLNVISQNFAMTLGTSLSKSLSSFATARHDCFSIECLFVVVNASVLLLDFV